MTLVLSLISVNMTIFLFGYIPFRYVHLQEKYDQGHDEAVNDPIALHLGDRVITPKEYNETHNYQWPTMRQMRKVRQIIV